MSKLLVNEHPLIVLPSLAEEIGINEAIVLQQLHYWLDNPKVGKLWRGKSWVRNSIREWQEENFPFMSIATINRCLADLKSRGIVETTNELNTAGFDRTLWYSINYEALGELEKVVLSNKERRKKEKEERQKEKNDSVKKSEAFTQNDRMDSIKKSKTINIDSSIDSNIESVTPAQKEPAHFENFNALAGNGDIALSQDDKLAKEQLVKAIKAIVKDKTALVKIYDLADTLLEKKVTPEILTKLFGAGGWWFTSCPLNKAGSPPYVKNIANELDTALATLEVKETTPAVLSPSVVMAHVEGLRGLQNGTYKEAVSRLPDNVKAIMSQALRLSKKIGFNTLAEADITAVMVKEIG